MLNAQIQAAWAGPPQCEHCGIRDLVLFSDLRQEDFVLIHKPIEEKRFAIAETLYHEGDAPQHVFTIREGLVKLVQYLPDGKQRIVRILKQGDLAGLELLLGQPYQHTAIALEPVLTCRIPLSVVQRLSDDTPRLHRQLMSRWQRALTEADSWLTELSTGTAPQRVARLLLRLHEFSRGKPVYIPSREDMGAMLGITTETASRVTAELKREGLLSQIDPHHAQLDIPAVRAIAGR